MEVGESTRVQARISKDVIEKVERQITEKMKGEGPAQARRIKVSRFMTLLLVGEDFKVTPLQPDRQEIVGNFRTWEWNIEPTSGGTKVLSLTIVTYTDEPGSSTSISDVEDWTVEVYVTASDRVSRFVRDNWQWLFSAVLVPVAGWAGWRLVFARMVKSIAHRGTGGQGGA
jgi:uncharacterized protein YchJ